MDCGLFASDDVFFVPNHIVGHTVINYIERGRSMKKSQSFFGGAFTLIVGAIVVKIIGAVFKIPLTNILGGVGMGFYMSAYGIFGPIYSMSVAGFPVAVSRLVSKAEASGRAWESKSILKAGLLAFMFIGSIGCLLLIMFADELTSLIGNTQAYYSVLCIAPAILFCALSSALRGYNEGGRNMMPTAVSQMIEAVLKLTFGILFCLLVLSIGTDSFHTGEIFGIPFGSGREGELLLLSLASAGAISGVTVGSVGAFLYLFFVTVVKKDKTNRFIPPHLQRTRTTTYIWQILALALPVCTAALMANITSLIDLGTIMNRLSDTAVENPDLLRISHGYSIPSHLTGENISSFLFGSYTGLALTIFNILPTFCTAIGTSALPLISSLYTKGRRRELREAVNSILKVTSLIAFPAGMGIAVLSEPILSLLFFNNPAEVAVAAPMLRTLGVAVMFVAFAAPINAILQATGKVYTPAKLMLIGGLIKLTLNHFLVGIPAINIKGAPVGTICCYVFIVVAGLRAVDSSVGTNLNLIPIMSKPFISALLCAGTAYTVQTYLETLTESRLVVLVSVATGALVYLISVLLLRTITENDLILFKNGNKFKKILEKRKLLG